MESADNLVLCNVKLNLCMGVVEHIVVTSIDPRQDRYTIGDFIRRMHDDLLIVFDSIKYFCVECGAVSYLNLTPISFAGGDDEDAPCIACAK